MKHFEDFGFLGTGGAGRYKYGKYKVHQMAAIIDSIKHDTNF